MAYMRYSIYTVTRKNVLGYRGGLIHSMTIDLYLFAFAAWHHHRVATAYTAVVEWTECAHRHTHRQTKVKTVYPPVLLGLLGRYSKLVVR